MSENGEQKNNCKKSLSLVSPDTLYNTMSQEADGLYRQLMTIGTSFFGGSLLGFVWFIFNNERIKSEKHLLWLLFVAWIALIYTVGALTWIRWQNVESHRHVLEYLKLQGEEKCDKADKEYNKAKSISSKNRKWMSSVFVSVLVGIILIAVFTAMIIL